MKKIKPNSVFSKSPVRTVKSQIMLFAMVLPAFVCVVIFNYIPMYGVTFAIREVDFNHIWRSGFADPLFKYFAFFSDTEFWNVFKNTIVIAVSKFAAGFPAPIILALLLNEIRVVWFKRFVQTVSYLPHFISWVVISAIVGAMFSIQFGPLADIYNLFGLEMPDILGSEGSFVPLMVALSVWQSIGWGTIIYLAALTGINPILYESSEIDGAKRLQKIWNITIPGLMPTISILLVLAIPSVINAGFEQIYNFQNPMVMSVGEIVDTYILRIGLVKGNYSLATAVGLFNSIIAIMLMLITNTISKKQGGQGIW
jgi:ABC-type polysaccharide transport system, permease component